MAAKLNRSGALNRSGLMAAAAGLASLAGVASAQVFSVSPGILIPPGQPTTTNGTNSTIIPVAGGPTSITDLNVIVGLTHSYCADIDIILVPPAGNAYIHLTSDNGGNGDNFNFTRFDQSASIAISAGGGVAVAPFNGNFRPEGGTISWRSGASIPLPGPALANLNAVNGTDSNGNWRLIIDDDANGDFGTLNYVSLEFNGALDPLGPPAGSPPFGSGGQIADNPLTEGVPAVFSLIVNPGTLPTSTGLIVTGLATGWGTPETVSFNDQGLDGDLVAGDGRWSATILPGPVPSLRSLNVSIADDQGRSSTFRFSLEILATPSGACCLPTGCEVLRRYECELLSGTFFENADCTGITYDVSTSAGAFENIATTGTEFAILADGDDEIEPLAIGFPFTYFGDVYTTINVSTNGNAQFPPFLSPAFFFDAIPNAEAPNNVLFVLADDYSLDELADGNGTIYTQTLGTSGVDLRTIIQWDNVRPLSGDPDVTFQLVLFEDGAFEYRYLAVNPLFPDNLVIGYENATGSAGFQILDSELEGGNTGRRFTINQGAAPCDGPSCPACPADFDQDGGVTGADVEAFFLAFEAGDACGDTDLDGGVTGADVEAFFLAFENGGC
jgi:subtilisin-like proprotein convertase family protein